MQINILRKGKSILHKKHLYIPHKLACKVKYIKCNRKGTVTNSKAEKRSKKGNNMQKDIKLYDIKKD